MILTPRKCALWTLVLTGSVAVLAGCGTPDASAPHRAAAASPTASPSPAARTASPSPVITTRTVTKARSIPYQTRRVDDASLDRGTTRVRTAGAPGVKTLTYQVTYTNGVETSRRLMSTVVTRQPVTKVVAVGTRAASNCDPNYSGACVPIASDVDCAGGGGNGPAYVQGPVRVVGTDIYDLDDDGDGIGCE
jgi:resuscitation-promoting factor RpfB